MAEARSDMAAAERLVDERARLHDAFKRLWNEDAIVQVQYARMQTKDCDHTGCMMKRCATWKVCICAQCHLANVLGRFHSF